MFMKLCFKTLLLYWMCGRSSTIKVPIERSDDSASEVKSASTAGDYAVDSFKPHNVQNQPVIPIPAEYFQYTAEKPQYAIDIAKFHGVQSPENHYSSYPIRPYTGYPEPDLGKHHIYDPKNHVHEHLQKYKEKEYLENTSPVSSNYEVFHPYKEEEPGLQKIYKDPILEKIRNDLRDSKHRLEKYEVDGGEPDISKDEYLESPEETDRKKFPQRNIPADFEIHRPMRRPVYYKMPPPYNPRHRHLNHRFKHPLNQNYVKIKPMHYRSLHNHLQRLRHQQAYKYDDENNEYPHLPPVQNYEQPPEGYDIYEKGRENYARLRNNVDLSINEAIKESRPQTHQNLELQSGENAKGEYNDDESEFVPVKSYAQVRKTERTRHLPRYAALEEAESFDEIKNAPRLREAVKSTKAQTVYSEEGYEDSAYDHAGEQKHASDHEGHGGYLKEKESSGGNYRIPSLIAAYSDGGGSIEGDKTVHGKKWKNNDKDSEQETEAEDYSDDEHEKLIEADVYQDSNAGDSVSDDDSQQGNRGKRDENIDYDNDKNVKESAESEDTEESEVKSNERRKREDTQIHKTSINGTSERDLSKRETKFEVPEINLNNTYLTEKEILQLAKEKIIVKKDNIRDKYPYYFKNFDYVNKHSPLRYAEDMKFIPKKSRGGTEFYDSRSVLECPEVDDVDPIPDKIKNNGTNTEEDTHKNRQKRQADPSKEQPRLAGLGDKIDCFKAKYFGENPLDSPFFKEDIIAGPEPFAVTYKLKGDLSVRNPKFENIFSISEKLREENKRDIFELFDQLSRGRSQVKPINIINLSLQNNSSKLAQQSDGTNLSRNIHALPVPVKKLHVELPDEKTIIISNNATENTSINTGIAYKSIAVRRKRAAPFLYEPYKIIRDSQAQDSKKTTTTSNISPLIRQLQSSNIVDKVISTSSSGKIQPVKRNVSTKSYKDIGKKERKQSVPKEKEASSEIHSDFIDVSVDPRRGEPRYELKPVNHKARYSPVENKKSMTFEDYEAQTKSRVKHQDIVVQNSANNNTVVRRQRLKPTNRPFFDVSKFLPTTSDILKSASTSTVRRVVRTTISPSTEKEINKIYRKTKRIEESEESEEDSEEYDNDDEQQEVSTTTSTRKPTIRRKIRVTSTSSTTTTAAPNRHETADSEENNRPKLRLVTRFRQPHAKKQDEKEEAGAEKEVKVKEKEPEYVLPKYREKSKKSTKSTIVTDTKRYGDHRNEGNADDDDDMRKDEVDAMIGVNYDTNEYVPRYEKEIENKKSKESLAAKKQSEIESSKESPKDYKSSEEEYNDSYEDDDDDNEDDESGEEEYEEEEEEEKEEPVKTTPDPPKRTIARTTEAPLTTTESRSAKYQVKPIVVKKKIEIHKELPVNKSSPHVSQYKQDIKEVEVIKVMPRRRPQKNVEVLDLYKDTKLAEEVNKLGDVEVFKENLDIKAGPKHGGNYRSANIVELVEASTSPALTGGNLKGAIEVQVKSRDLDTAVPVSQPQRTRSRVIKTVRNSQRSDPQPETSNQSAKLVELSEPEQEKPPKPMHGGNLMSYQDVKRRDRDSSRNAKLIELDDEDTNNDDSSEQSHGGSYQSRERSSNSRHPGRSLHGGNYRSAQIIAKTHKDEDENEKDDDENDEPEELTKQDNLKSKSERSKGRISHSAATLNSFVQAVPILTTTPSYIVDPSKRMYYYVDA